MLVGRFRLRAGLAAGMMEAVNGFESSQCEVGVDLGGGDIGVAKEYLDAAEVCAVLNHVGGATVAEGVWAGGSVRRFDQEPDRLAGHGGAAGGEEEGGAAFFFGAVKVGTAVAEVDFEGVEGGLPEGNDALFVAFATNEDAA